MIRIRKKLTEVMNQVKPISKLRNKVQAARGKLRGARDEATGAMKRAGSSAAEVKEGMVAAYNQKGGGKRGGGNGGEEKGGGGNSDAEGEEEEEENLPQSARGEEGGGGTSNENESGMTVEAYASDEGTPRKGDDGDNDADDADGDERKDTSRDDGGNDGDDGDGEGGGTNRRTPRSSGGAGDRGGGGHVPLITPKTLFEKIDTDGTGSLDVTGTHTGGVVCVSVRVCVCSTCRRSIVLYYERACLANYEMCHMYCVLYCVLLWYASSWSEAISSSSSFERHAGRSTGTNRFCASGWPRGRGGLRCQRMLGKACYALAQRVSLGQAARVQQDAIGDPHALAVLLLPCEIDRERGSCALTCLGSKAALQYPRRFIGLLRTFAEKRC